MPCFVQFAKNNPLQGRDREHYRLRLFYARGVFRYGLHCKQRENLLV